MSGPVTVTQEQVNKLRHALGADKAKRGVAFRNYYCSTPDDPGMAFVGIKSVSR